MGTPVGALGNVTNGVQGLPVQQFRHTEEVMGSRPLRRFSDLSPPGTLPRPSQLPMPPTPGLRCPCSAALSSSGCPGFSFFFFFFFSQPQTVPAISLRF